MNHDGLIAGLRAKLAANRTLHREPPMRTLEDAAPETHARVEAVRAANPGLQAPPMREPQPAPTTDPDHQEETDMHEPEEAVS